MKPAGDPPRARPLAPPAARPERQAALRLDLSAQSRAAAFLIAKGFRILARRWRSPAGEIDIVARRRHLLVFVAVAARASLDDAAWPVTESRRARFVAAAEIWRTRLPAAAVQAVRFDAMLVAPGRIPRHLPAAFDAPAAAAADGRASLSCRHVQARVSSMAGGKHDRRPRSVRRPQPHRRSIECDS